MIQYLNVFFYDIFPYLCAPSFWWAAGCATTAGSILRASSSQMLISAGWCYGRTLFHIGILGIFFGHLFGMLTPHWVYSWFLPMSQKQLMAMILGGICGVLTLVGRPADAPPDQPTTCATSTTADILILHPADSVRAGG
ncbi:respiratory nitrate reductase subunit gamma [Klebsiella pneumoniae]|nr:respiratory nitrate reductase subunit gamma [Klebsiella pneumoniae]